MMVPLIARWRRDARRSEVDNPGEGREAAVKMESQAGGGSRGGKRAGEEMDAFRR
jgi:hypothetical protein